MQESTNGSDPASDGCDNSSGFGTFYDGLLTSPIVLDMDGDGLELISLDASHVYFDMDNDDFAEVVGWVQPDDAFLAMDHNGNGVIDNQNELFGNTGFVDAFDKLDAYDSNHDNKITSADAQFGDFRVWTDANGNGLTDTGELKTLSEAGISVINLNETYAGDEIAGHVVYEEATFVRNGQTHTLADVFFQTDQGHSAYKLDDSFVYDTDVFTLPQLRGFGDAPDLWVAMTQDATLKQMVTGLTDADYSDFDYGSYYDAVEQMLFRWTGTDGVAAGSDWDVYGNDQVRTAVEKWLGVYGKTAVVPEYGGDAEGQFLDLWHQFVDAVAVRLLIQIPTQPLFAAFSEAASQYAQLVANGEDFDTWTDQDWNAEFGGIFAAANTAIDNHPLKFLSGLEYDFISNAVAGDFPAFIDTLQQHEPPTPGLKDAYWENWMPFVNAVAKDQAYTDAEYDTALAGTWWDVRHTEPVSSLRDGVNLVGTISANSLVGSNGDDILMGSNRYQSNPNPNDNDTFSGGAGDDLLQDFKGNDRYIYNLGDGNDTIQDFNGSFDLLSFGAGMTFADLEVHQYYHDYFSEASFSASQFLPSSSMLLTLPQDGSVAIQGGGLSKIETVYFTQDSSSKTWQQMQDAAQASSQTASHDFIHDTTGNDTIHGGAGNDVIAVNDGNNIIEFNLGDGVDRIFGDSYTTNTVQFGTGINYSDISALVTPTMTAIIVNNNDMLLIMETDWREPIDVFAFTDGTQKTMSQIEAEKASGDTIQGSGAVTGASGNDYLVGVSSNKILSGQSGNDILEATRGTGNTLLGGDGNDFLLSLSASSLDGGNGGDTLSGGGTLKGGAGDDQLYGDTSNDTLYGGTGNDFLFGRGGDDILRGEGGNNTLAGGTGNDRFVIATEPGTTTVIKDFVEYLPDELIDLSAFGGALALSVQQVGSHVQLLLPNNQIVVLEIVSASDLGLHEFMGVASIDLVTESASIITGTPGADSLVGTAGNDTIQGLGGNDTLAGGAGNDTLNGGDGNDSLDGGAGADSIVGGNGTDTLTYAAAAAAVNANLTTGAGAGSDAAGDVISGVEKLIGSAYADTLTGSANADTLDGGAGNDTITSNAGNDSLIGGAGNDTLKGGDGNDSLTAGDGTDKLYGDAGADTLDGGNGNDSLDGGAGADSIVGGNGTDTLTYALAAAAVNANLTTGAGTGSDAAGDVISGVEKLIGSAYGDTLTGSANADTLDGGAGNDTITSNAGNDSLIGGAGNDTLKGGDGNDSLTAGDGVDKLYGDAGADTLTGGAGIDTFHYTIAQVSNTKTSVDTIADFGNGADLIDFTDLTLANLHGTGAGLQKGSATTTLGANTGLFISSTTAAGFTVANIEAAINKAGDDLGADIMYAMVSNNTDTVLVKVRDADNDNNLTDAGDIQFVATLIGMNTAALNALTTANFVDW